MNPSLGEKRPTYSNMCLLSEKKASKDSREGERAEVLVSQETGNIEDKKQPENPFLVDHREEINGEKTETKNRNPFEGEDDRANPFVKANDKVSVNEEEVPRKEQNWTTQHPALTFGRCGERNDTFEDYESVISDIEETLSILSRNSRSTTPVSELGYGSRTPTPSLGGNFFSLTDLSPVKETSVADKHVIPVVTVFDDLKDYLSDSDVSLDYKIALQRRRHKNSKNLNKQAQLSSFLTTCKSRKLEEDGESNPKHEEELNLKRTTLNMNVSDNSRLQDDKSCPDGVVSGSLKRKGSAEGSRSRRSPSTTRATSLEPILEEQRGVRLCEVGPLRNGGLPEEIGAGEGSDGIPCSPTSTQTQGPVRVCVEKWENLFGTTSKHEEETGGSLNRRKHLRTSSLSNLLPSQNRNTSLSPSPGPTFARTFQESSPPAAGIRLAVNKSASECNLAQWVGRPSLKGREELKLITEYLGIDNSMVEKVGNTSNGGMGKEEKNMDIDSKIVEGIDTNMMLEKTRLGNFKPEHGNNSFTEKGRTKCLLPPSKN